MEKSVSTRMANLDVAPRLRNPSQFIHYILGIFAYNP